MSSIIVAGDVSGSVTLQAPSAAGTTTLTLPTTSGTVVTSATSTGINASALSTGTVPTARLASGTADSTTYLRGDQTWATVSTTPTTNQVLSATAGASAGDVGTYAFLGRTSTTTITSGTNYAGSSLVFSGLRLASASSWSVQGDVNPVGAWGSGVPSGTWKAMGAYAGTGNCPATVFLRVS